MSQRRKSNAGLARNIPRVAAGAPAAPAAAATRVLDDYEKNALFNDYDLVINKLSDIISNNINYIQTFVGSETNISSQRINTDKLKAYIQKAKNDSLFRNWMLGIFCDFNNKCSTTNTFGEAKELRDLLKNNQPINNSNLIEIITLLKSACGRVDRTEYIASLPDLSLSNLQAPAQPQPPPGLLERGYDVARRCFGAFCGRRRPHGGTRKQRRQRKRRAHTRRR